MGAQTKTGLLPPSPQADGTASPFADLGLQPLRHERMAQRVYDGLFQSIVTGKLQPQARLPSELDLARFFGVSRPVVRQALEALRAAGLVKSMRGSGTYVRAETSPMPVVPLARSAEALRHFAQGIELRLVVEPECAFLAASRRKPDQLARMDTMQEAFERAAARGEVAHPFDFGFHEAIAEAAANPRIVQVIKSLEYDLSHAVSLWRHLASRKGSGLQSALSEHRAILAAIRAGDGDAARRAMRTHLEHAHARFLAVRPGRMNRAAPAAAAKSEVRRTEKDRGSG
jgi:GntR family transcriptional regulator, transcriptional repressor for pyruvate dehydrogenase complex